MASGVFLKRDPNKFLFNSFIKDVEKELDKAEKKVINKAAGVLKRKIRANIKALNLVDSEGDLLAGVSSTTYKHTVLIGMKPPAYHAQLIELGHRVVKHDGTTDIADGKKTFVKGRPYFLKAFQDKKEKIIDTLSEEWV